MATGGILKEKMEEDEGLKLQIAKEEEEARKSQQSMTQEIFDSVYYDVAEFNRHTDFSVSIDGFVTTGEIHSRYEDCQRLRAVIQQNIRLVQRRPMTANSKKKFDEIAEQFNSVCWKTLGAFQEAVATRNRIDPNLNDTTANSSASSSSAPRVKFPVISLPEFHGSLEEWIGFRDRFDSLVNKNEGLSKVDKFNYLLAAVKLPAGQTSVLKNFTLSEANYESAWTALCERYDDKTKLKAQQFNTMLTMKRMTTESAPELRRIIDDFTSCFATLDLLGATHEDLRIHVVLFRLDDQTRKDWQKFIGDDEPTWENLRGFLVKQWRSVITVAEPIKRPTAKPVETRSPGPAKNFASSTDSLSCPICREQHLLFRCQKFRAFSVSERMNAVNSHRLCRNCLSPNHIQRNCTSQNRCKMCSQSHHTMLHFEKSSNVIQTSGAPPVANGATPPVPFQRTLNANSASFPPNVDYSSSEGTMNMHATMKSFPACYEALLSTVSINVLDVNGSWQLCRALLDSGSQSNYITTEFAKRVGISLVPINMPVIGINGQSSVVRHSTTAIFASRYKDFNGHAPCLVSDDITGFLPNRPISLNNFKIPSDVFLADPKFHVPGKIDMLFGTGIFHSSRLGNTLELPNMPMLVETKFGWTLGGEFQVSSPAVTLISCFTQMPNSGFDELDAKLDKFMEVENYGLTKKLLTPEESYCEDLFRKTTKRDASGRIIVQLPFNEFIVELGTNWSNALRQFFYQESQRLKDPVYNELYCKYINEMISSGHMSEVSGNGKTEGHYLPHHGVVKMSSVTTKVRPVCNGASKSETGKSLNDCLHCGPTVQSEIFDILIRFRERSFVLKCDIEKMYRQVFLEPSQRKWQKILWRNSPSEPLRHYELNTVVFGLKSSPFLATRSLNYIADENIEKFPQVSSVIRTSIYVDDFLCSFDSLEEGVKLRDQLRYLLSSSHFLARKWVSNNRELLRNLPMRDMDEIQDDSTNIKTLGLKWNPTRDEVSISMKMPESDPKTKAGILSEIASIYDVLGLFGPVVLKAKLFMKPLRCLKWTEKVPEDELQRWMEFRSQIDVLNDVKVQRHVILSNPVSIQLHGFSDASESGYGAVIYIRSCDSFGNVQVSLLCSKSRVSPSKQKSIPRLELCAATLLAKFATRIIDVLTVDIEKVFLWSDSMIVLWWIKAVAARLSTFVGNRIAVIQELTSRFIWKHLRGPLNPADDLSRGLLPKALVDRPQWWFGPAFLQSPPSEWHDSLLTIQEDHPEVSKELRKTLVVSPASSLFNLIESRFSYLKKVMNCFVYIRRLAAKEDFKTSGPISIDETERATKSIVKILQAMFFPQEVRFFNEKLTDAPRHHQFPKNSPLLQLTPFMDEQGIMRVGGRIQASPMLTEDQKHPAILPHCKFVKLIIRDMHKKLLHPSQTTLLAHVRQTYWPINAKSVIRQVQHECLICFRAKPKTAEQLMGSLPLARVRMSPPFESTAVDYAGFFNIRASLTKKSTIVKAYVAVFKCMCTGAIHLEAVTSLSTPAFINVFDRFISRRGLSKEIFSDNGTQFVGANNEFRRILKELEPSIGEYLKEKMISWKFTTPIAPHAGGYYESGVKSMKHHLMRECADRSFDFEQFSTLLCKIEAILNSRPLTPMSEDPRDLDVLTPAHFLTGRPLITKSERNFLPVNTGRLDKFNQLQQLQQKIWDRWYQEYLHNLQKRPINFRQLNEFHVGDLVLVKDLNLPPLKWVRGRIIKVHPDKNNVVRNVLIKTPTGEKLRHVRYLCFLPFEKSSE